MNNLVGVYAAAFVVMWTGLLLAIGLAAWAKEWWQEREYRRSCGICERRNCDGSCM